MDLKWIEKREQQSDDLMVLGRYYRENNYVYRFDETQLMCDTPGALFEWQIIYGCEW